MGIATTPTKLPLATWAQILGVHPLHFEGISFTQDGQSTSFCEAPTLQYPWHAADKLSREDIAMAIAEAEMLLERQLGWDLIPTWIEDEWRPGPRLNRPEVVSSTFRDMRGQPPAITPQHGKVIMGGVEAKVLVDRAAAIVWSDVDGDGVSDTATVTFAVTGDMVSCELEAYYPGHDGDGAFQIRPAEASITGLVGTLVFKRQLAVEESLLFGFSAVAIDFPDDSDFLSVVEVWRHYNNPAQQATLMWGSGCPACGGGGCSSCAFATQAACITLRMGGTTSMLGFTPAVYDPTTGSFSSQSLALSRWPDLVRLWYQAGNIPARGCPLVMDPVWARCVTYLSCSLLERPMCDCTADTWGHWREDYAAVSGGEQAKTYGGLVVQKAAESPFGTRRGALYAWQRVCDPGVAAVGSMTPV